MPREARRVSDWTVQNNATNPLPLGEGAPRSGAGEGLGLGEWALFSPGAVRRSVVLDRPVPLPAGFAGHPLPLGEGFTLSRLQA
jgi:hypothetical protein